MIVNPLATVETGRAGGFDDGLKIPVIGIAEHLGKIPAGSEFVARRIRPANPFKWRNFLIHTLLPAQPIICVSGSIQ